MMKFLIDECLTPALAQIAIEAGFPESAHVNHRGMREWEDHHIFQAAIISDWTLVTRNAKDFRPLYARQELHAGLVLLNLPADFARGEHKLYFGSALEFLGFPADLTNEVLEVWPDAADPNKTIIECYPFPAD